MRIIQRYRRRASMYVAVLATTLVVSVIGLSALTLTRIERVQSEGAIGLSTARFYALSAIELGLLKIGQTANWRDNLSSGIWMDDQVIGVGRYTLYGVDPVDSNFANNQTDPLVLTGDATAGASRFKLQVTLHTELPPIDALKTCLHAGGDIDVASGALPTMIGAPLSTNALLNNEGTITGNVEALAVSGAGLIVGTVTAPAPPKDPPDSGVFSYYIGVATAIPYSGEIKQTVLGPGYNPWGVPNADGVYYVNTGGGDLKIQGTRVHGTLIVVAGGGTVTVEDAALLHPARADYPVLLVDGALIVRLDSGTRLLSEVEWLANFNPSGAPYEGDSDLGVLLVDTYPNEIRGLVHVKGSVAIERTSTFRGTVILEGMGTLKDAGKIVYDSTIHDFPPVGYTKPPVMNIVSGTWKQIVD